MQFAVKVSLTFLDQTRSHLTLSREFDRENSTHNTCTNIVKQKYRCQNADVL